jgi:hypothetical protein
VWRRVVEHNRFEPQLNLFFRFLHQGYDLDRHLNDKELGELRAFRSLFEESLKNIHVRTY